MLSLNMVKKWLSKKVVNYEGSLAPWRMYRILKYKAASNSAMFSEFY